MSRSENENNPRDDEKNVTFDLEDRVTFADFVEEPLPDDIIFPSELNTFFRDRIRDLQWENGNLRRQIDESREALEKLRKTCGPEVQGKKIEAEEWSKKYRHQTAELEVLKTKYKKLEEKLSTNEIELENKILKDKEHKETEKKPTESIITSEEEARNFQAEIAMKEEQLRVLTEKLQQSNAKLYETKNACTSLRQEVNKAQKLLCREIGENVTIASLSNRSSGWRGRAEQVQHLQQKVAELHAKLSESDRSFSSTKSTTTFTVSSEQRNIAYLRNLEKERRVQMENSSRELKQAESELEANKKKLQAAKARIKILESDLNNAKTNVVLLNEKRIHDDQLIEALNGQLRAVEDRFREREHELRYQKEKAQESCNELKNELSAVKMQVELFRKKLEERETEIEKLRESNGRPKPERVWQPPPIKSSQVTPTSTPRNLKDPNEYVTMSLAAEAERQRLFELVTLLNRRLDKERTDTDRINELLREERNKNARLETKLQRLELDRVGIARVNTGYRAKCSKSFVNLTSRENLNAEKIQFKLELLEEECLALKTRLATVQQDKENDLAIYKKMLETTRRTFQDAFRGKMSYTAGCHSNVTI